LAFRPPSPCLRKASRHRNTELGEHPILAATAVSVCPS
jgi:hypothetical protein